MVARQPYMGLPWESVPTCWHFCHVPVEPSHSILLTSSMLLQLLSAYAGDAAIIIATVRAARQLSHSANRRLMAGLLVVHSCTSARITPTSFLIFGYVPGRRCRTVAA